jgi:hypothetical protein
MDISVLFRLINILVVNHWLNGYLGWKVNKNILILNRYKKYLKILLLLYVKKYSISICLYGIIKSHIFYNYLKALHKQKNYQKIIKKIN